MAKRLLIKSQIVKKEQLTKSVTSLQFLPVHRERFPAYRGGAHVLVRLPDGTMRPYSLCGDPARPEWRIAIRAQQGPVSVSQRLCHEFKVGDFLYLSYPQERFALDMTAGHHRLVAAGIGITPMLSLLYQLNRDSPSSPAELHYFVRSRREAVFLAELALLNVHLHLYPADSGRPNAVDVASDPKPGEHLYYCGPQSMARELFHVEHLWDGRVHSENFIASQDTTTSDRGPAFEVNLTKTGRTIPVDSRETLLQALLSAGVRVDSACEGGVCGTCVVDVDSKSSIDHRDHCLTQHQRTSAMATCVSRGHGTINLLL